MFGQLNQISNNSSVQMLYILLFECNFIWLIITTNVATSILVLGAVLGIVVGISVYFQIAQALKLVFKFKNSRQNQNSNLQFATFLHRNIECLRLLVDINRVCGKAFFAFLLLNCPVNASLLMTLHFHQMELLFKICILSVVFDQVVFIFGFHIFVASQSLKYHRPARIFMQNGLLHKFASGSARLKLKHAHYVQHFHTDKIYGLNFGNFGQITFVSFGKVFFVCLAGLLAHVCAPLMCISASYF